MACDTHVAMSDSGFIGKIINHATQLTCLSTMPFPTSDLIALEIKAHSQDEITRILCTFSIMMENEKKVKILSIDDENGTVLSIYDLGGSMKYI